MNKNLKKFFIIGTSFLMLTGIGAGIKNSSTNVYASNIHLSQYPPRWERVDGIAHWGVSIAARGAYIQHNGKWHVRYYAKTFHKNGHSFLIKSDLTDPGDIIAMDGNHHVSNKAVKKALAPRHHHARHHARKHGRRSRR